ncbi:hypothetical protein L1887_61693 [Cichorium endivia]|nr:hypothetical protein L1887_61693 [Cichorium endivia]
MGRSGVWGAARVINRRASPTARRRELPHAGSCCGPSRRSCYLKQGAEWASRRPRLGRMRKGGDAASNGQAGWPRTFVGEECPAWSWVRSVCKAGLPHSARQRRKQRGKQQQQQWTHSPKHGRRPQTIAAPPPPTFRVLSENDHQHFDPELSTELALVVPHQLLLCNEVCR